jgi:hypothetical protein
VSLLSAVDRRRLFSNFVWQLWAGLGSAGADGRTRGNKEDKGRAYSTPDRAERALQEEKVSCWPKEEHQLFLAERGTY